MAGTTSNLQVERRRPCPGWSGAGGPRAGEGQCWGCPRRPRGGQGRACGWGWGSAKASGWRGRGRRREGRGLPLSAGAGEWRGASARASALVEATGESIPSSALASAGGGRRVSGEGTGTRRAGGHTSAVGRWSSGAWCPAGKHCCLLWSGRVVWLRFLLRLLTAGSLPTLCFCLC